MKNWFFINIFRFLLKKFRIIPEKNIDTVRLIDFSQEVPSLFEKNTIFLSEKIAENEEMTYQNYYQRLLPLNYDISRDKIRKIGRYKYQGKITRKGLIGFLANVSNKSLTQYYECSLNFQKKNSIHLLGF